MKKKSFNLIYVLALLLVAGSCKKDDVPELPVYGEASMVSFGFYAEDNQGVLFNDYVVENVTGDFTISLPDYVEKSALVARFEVTENDTVYVGDVLQESSVSENDFTSPVDYIVSEGTNNSRYTVTVGDLPDAVWSQVKTDTTKFREFKMVVNPVDNLPYIAYVLDATETEDRKMGVFKFDGTEFTSVGTQGFSEGRSADPGITFDANGDPFVIFADYTNPDPLEEGSTTYSASVMAYKGSSWSYVGGDAGKGITDVRITYNDIVIKEDGNPIIFCYNNDEGALPRRELNISEFDGSAWTTSMQMPGRPAGAYAYYPTAKIVNGVIYLAILNVNEGSFSVYKNVEGTWSTIAESFYSEGATTAHLRDFDMDIDKDGNVYVCVADDQAGEGIYRPNVLKYDAATETWGSVGTPIVVDFSTTREFSLAISPAGIPYLMYRNDSKFPEVVSFDKETQDWSSPVQLDASESENLFMDFAENGVAYAVYTNSTTDETVLFKYDIPQE